MVDSVLKEGKLFIDTAGSLLSIRRSFKGDWRYALINPGDETVETALTPYWNTEAECSFLFVKTVTIYFYHPVVPQFLNNVSRETKG